MDRRREAGFSFIEILVVMGIITVLVSMVVMFIPRITEKARQTKSLDNLRTLTMFSLDEAATDLAKWPPVDGKGFVLWPVASGKISKKSAKDLEILFSPGDTNYTLEGIGYRAYEAVTKAALRDGTEDFRKYTSYAGRRNKQRDHKITATEMSRGGIILCDDDDGPLHHELGICVAFANGRTDFMDWDELEIAAPDNPDAPEGLLGDNAQNPDLKHMSSGN